LLVFRDYLVFDRGIYDPEPERAEILWINSGWNYRLYSSFYVYAIKVAAVDEQ